MSYGNKDQIEEWNGVLGQRWATLRDELAVLVAPFDMALMAAAAVRPGEQVLDVGCGCGDTSIEIARRVGSEGRVTGIDVSRPMLAVAIEAMKREQLGNLSFVEADASVASLPAEYDLLFSRFGMMFFGDPEAAFTHLRKFLRPGGRMVFICWRHPRDNPWAMTPFVAARKSVAVEMAPGDPTAPGPFSLADENRLRDLLSRAGLRNVRVERFDAPVVLGVDVRAAADAAMRFGPTARLVREMGSGHAETIRQAVEAALAPAAGPEGHVRLNGSTWIVSAENTPSV